MVASIPFLCPIDGSRARVAPVLTNKGERQSVICNTHGVLAWVGAGPVGDFGGGVQASFNAGAATLDDLSPGEYAHVAAGAFAGVWAAFPPEDQAAPVIVPTQYAAAAKGFPSSVDDPSLTVAMPFTGAWRGRLSGGVWYQATDLL